MIKKLNSQVKMLQQRGPWKYTHFLMLKLAKSLKIGLNFPYITPKNIDIVYVVHQKDSGALNRSINSLNLIKNIKINNIFIISNNVAHIRTLIKDHRVIFIDEIDVVDFSIDHYPYPLESALPNRSGWLFQQFLKLGWSIQSESENYIVIDADTYFIKPISFFDHRDRFIFFGVEEWWPPYFAAFNLLFNERPPALWSRVAHMMIFNKKNVLRMFAELESIHQVPWHEAIAKTRSLSSHACFSEYETYANWMLLRNPKQCSVRPSYNTNANNPKLNNNCKNFNSISSHSYL
ncbi:hypothetical protein ICN19_03025 [Polynucleobacter sp. AP-Capit-er-40B-B4]|uniref:DUF6492 family protein n=1 Tax=Polynucleobacter sp. AP-Capit-er-40B-B4 TaxID=2576927 RepID=UPI001C0E7080|nr:DUF6492 family protein [Polynucleobacter sp. AP-Capit-er-40B-B4]MBU3580986.1 hypothetical protein [Polynucleobacter sp. AP-Capit-er-40B-B4]